MRLVRFYDSDGDTALAVNPEEVTAVYTDEKTGQTLIDVREGSTFIVPEHIGVEEAVANLESR